MLPNIHEMNNVGNDHFVCRACGYEGNLEQAVAHATNNQFVFTQEEEDEDNYA
jgi:hypothetical protein